MGLHMLSRDEIQNLRENLKAEALDEEAEAQIDVLCDMALSDLLRTLASVKADRALSQALNEGDGSYKP